VSDNSLLTILAYNYAAFILVLHTIASVIDFFILLILIYFCASVSIILNFPTQGHSFSSFLFSFLQTNFNLQYIIYSDYHIPVIIDSSLYSIHEIWFQVNLLYFKTFISIHPLIFRNYSFIYKLRNCC